MACLLKIPDEPSKGVVTFTTQEWRYMSTRPALREQLASLRSSFVLGLHFNWHDFNFVPPPLFDFFMAGEEDLRVVGDTPFRLLPMDACNFTPSAYRPSSSQERFWDVLMVGNPVFFKRPEVGLRTIRRLFDLADRLPRVLYICPMPDHRFMDEDTVFYDVRSYYEALFTPEERSVFTLLTTNFDSPNPFDRVTLSHFFRSSKVFLHCPVEERRCRIAAYAWSAGLPVVAYPSVASILPQKLQIEPGYFAVNSDDEYVSQILSALDRSEEFDPEPYRQAVSEVYAIDRLKLELANIFADMNIPFSGDLLSANLDRRLGWHHNNLGGSSNGLKHPLDDFMRQLLELGPIATYLAAASYPERELSESDRASSQIPAQAVVRKSIYLNESKKKYLRYFKYAKAKIGI